MSLKLEHVLLLVAVIVVIYLYTYGMPSIPKHAVTPSPEPTAESDAQVDKKADAKTDTLATKMIAEGIAGVNACAGAQFAASDYGTPGSTFVEWAAEQTLDPRIIESNREFVADRLGNPQTWTGATYSPDRHDTYDAVPWRGLARPARVSVDSPDQIPDIDTNRYPASKKLVWDSTPTE